MSALAPPRLAPASDASAPDLPAAYAGWREVRTEHFRIIYEPRDEQAAREVISFAEDVYSDVTETLGYYPDTVPVVIRGRTATANGFYSPFPHHISLFVTSPSGVWMGARHKSWLRVLLTHELTHFVQFSDRTGFFGGLSRVFGHDISVFSFPFMPGWYVEAPTTLNETRLTAGGRGRNPFFEMQVKAPVLEGKLWSLDQASYESAFAPRGRIYIAGYVLADYLRRAYGEGTYARVHREFERIPVFRCRTGNTADHRRRRRRSLRGHARRPHPAVRARRAHGHGPAGISEGSRRLVPAGSYRSGPFQLR